MHCPTFADLPPPPEGKNGWPWTVETPPLPPTRSDGSAWPRISIVTPSYNQGQFIEETIRSVLLQGYPDLEYIIMDGGSTDGAVDIIRKYERWLIHWQSSPDGGQSAAINEGLRYASGSWGNWLNSDDLLTDGALAQIATAIATADKEVEAVCFLCILMNHDLTEVLGHWQLVPVFSVRLFLNGGLQPMAQPSTFRRLPFHLHEDLNLAMDWAHCFETINRNSRAFSFHSAPVSVFRHQPDCKTLQNPSDCFSQEEECFVQSVTSLKFFDKLWVMRWIRKRRSRRMIRQALNLRDLFFLVETYPELLLDRMFWGAVRRRLSNSK